MKKIILITIYTLCVFAVQSQEKYFVNATSGLNVRDAPSVISNKIDKLPYGSLVEILKITDIKLQITDNSEIINGTWVKVKFENFPFIVSGREEDLWYDGEGYVFSGFLEKLNKGSISTTEIDSLKFYSLYEPPKSSDIIKITSEKEAEKLLKGKVKWKEVEYLGRVINEIILDNGQVLKINQKSSDYVFNAYYPTEEVILFEGGHVSDFSISIKTGESLETVGNPAYIVESPNKKFRLNGFFPGQECSDYFFQEKIGTNYTYLLDFYEDVCNFNKFSWLNDQEFMYSYFYTDYSAKHANREIKYYIGQIIK